MGPRSRPLRPGLSCPPAAPAEGNRGNWEGTLWPRRGPVATVAGGASAPPRPPLLPSQEPHLEARLWRPAWVAIGSTCRRQVSGGKRDAPTFAPMHLLQSCPHEALAPTAAPPSGTCWQPSLAPAALLSAPLGMAVRPRRPIPGGLCPLCWRTRPVPHCLPPSPCRLSRHLPLRVGGLPGAAGGAPVTSSWGQGGFLRPHAGEQGPGGCFPETMGRRGQTQRQPL